MRNALPRVLAIHDLCAFGRCSLTAVIPVLSARGVQCCPLPTALLSAPTNYGGGTALSLTGEMPGILAHLRSLGTRFDAVYSGYLADPSQAALVEEAFGTFPGAFRVVDPVLGDGGKLYRSVGGGMSEAVRKLAGKARLITPNVTEAAVLLGKPADAAPAGEAEAADWLKTLSLGGSRSVVLTGLSFGKKKELAVGWTNGGASGFIRHTEEGGGFPGTGDLFTAYLLAELLYGATLAAAAGSASKFARDCAAFTVKRGTDPDEGLLFEAVLRQQQSR